MGEVVFHEQLAVGEDVLVVVGGTEGVEFEQGGGAGA